MNLEKLLRRNGRNHLQSEKNNKNTIESPAFTLNLYLQNKLTKI